MAWCLRAALIAALIAFSFAHPAWSASEPAGPSVEDLEALATTLEDDAKRAELLAAIRALIAVKRHAEDAAPPKTFSSRLIQAVGTATDDLNDAVAAVAAWSKDWPTLVDWAVRAVSDPGLRAKALREVGAIVLIFAVGGILELATSRLLRRTRGRLEHASRGPIAVRTSRILLHAGLDLVPLIAFAVAGYLTALAIQPAEGVRAVALNFVNAYVLARAVMVVARTLFAPDVPAMRLVPVADETANYLTVWVRRFVAVAVFGYFVIEAAVLLGLPFGAAELLRDALGLVILVLLIVVILQNKLTVSQWLARRGRTAERPGGYPVLRAIAGVWHLVAIAYLIAAYAVSLTGIEGGFAFMVRGTIASVVIVGVAIAVKSAASRLLARVFAIDDERERRHPGLRERANRYLAALSAVARGLLWIVVALAVLRAWGIDTLAWIESPLGQRLLGVALTMAIVVGAATLVWEAVNLWIGRYLAETDAWGRPVERSARARTLLPLMRKALLGFLGLMVVLITLSELGIDIAPLIAGAGVVGLAIGFGAQRLVQDIITGVFILVEDAISVGDVVNVAGIGGLVEAMSIRSLRLRDLSGTVHTIPFSSVGTVSNLTKEFSYYTMDIGVAYRENTDHVSEVIRAILEEMRADPEYGAFILEPLEVLGVDRFADSAVIIRARIKTRPIKQWMVGREFNRRMKKRFDELGIEIPFPHHTIYFGVDKDGSAPPARVRMEEQRRERQPRAAGGPAAD